ncbi:MAG: flavin reductase, partial [Chitinispirillia bacterium]
MKKIDFNDFLTKPVNLWLKKWLLLTAGNNENYNSMTIAWGSIGGMWQRPYVQVVVRPCRYTYEFMENYSTFTVCSFPEKYRDALKLLGSKSGRDSDKISESGLKIKKSTVVDTPCFENADLILECKKIYWQD